MVCSPSAGGGDNVKVLTLKYQAVRQLAFPQRLEVVPAATHLFEEPRTLDRVAALAAQWFVQHLPRGTPP